MRIRRLRIAGFKSFVEPVELLIERGLTGVVGPNGCGKSNLLEAIRWAMGEGSAKSLRGGGMDDVIFAGTAARPARAFAEVAIVADRDDPGGAMPREVEVVRRIERGAGSAYRIDGRDVRARDVALLFADAATGAHSPALVSQNRIAAIITARPAERRAMLEEAAGIAGLHVRRGEAEARLRAAAANLARLDDLLAETAARGTALRRQARAAERYRELGVRVRTAEARLIWARWRDAAGEAEAGARAAAAADARASAAGERQRAATAAREERAAALAATRAGGAAAREAAAGARQALAAARAAAEATARRLAELGRQREAIARDLAREARLAGDAGAALTRLDAEDRALVEALAAGERDRAATAAALREAEAAAHDADAALAGATAAEATARAERRVAEAALAAARQRRERGEAELARIAAEVAGLADAATVAARRAAAAAAREVAAGAGAAAREALDQAEAARETAAAARGREEERAAAARAALAALEAEARTPARPARGGAASALDHIRVSPGYERALAAALGDDLEAEVGPRGWTGAGGSEDDPCLPAGLAPLAGFVAAPAALARRLAQVGVADADAGVALAPGQRLVTRDGALRRWDGFVAEGGGAAAAARLARENRLREVEALLPGVRDAAAAALADAAAAAGRVGAAARAIDAARHALADADARERAAAREHDAVTGMLERAAAQRAAIGERRARAEAETIEARAAERAADAACAALPDGAAAATTIAALREAAARAASALKAVREAAARHAHRLDADRHRRDAARAEAGGWRARAEDAAARSDDLARRDAEVRGEVETLAGQPAALALAVSAEEARAGAAAAAERDARTAETALEAEARAAEREAAAAGEALAAAREVRAGAAARAEAQGLRRVEMGRIAGERFGCPAAALPERAGFASAEVGAAAAESAAHDRLIAERERLGPVNLVAAQELAELEAGHAASAAERDELTEAIARLRGSVGALNREGRERLRSAFAAVDGHFRRLFATLFEGGEAHLALTDSDDPLEAGLEIMAQPPGKKLAALTLLSGGEQALAAVALIFALFLTRPAPLCVLDEVDAPLDDANVERFCDLLDRMAAETDTRYLIVTHNPVTMARVHRLFGVTMVERGVSRLASVDLIGAEGLLAAE